LRSAMWITIAAAIGNSRWRKLTRRHRRSRLEKTASELTVLEKAVEGALKSCEAEDRLLLRPYYLDGRTLLQIAGYFTFTRQR